MSFFRETLMAKIFYGWWRKLQLLMDLRMMERMVRIRSNFFICSCIIYLMLFCCLNFALIRRFVCVLDYEKGKPGVGGLP